MTQSDEQIQDVLDTLSELAPGTADAPKPASQMLARMKQQIESPPQQSKVSRWSIMSNRRYAFASFILLIVIVGAFSFPGVRAAASDFLGLFRVQKFAPISISPEQLALLEEVVESGLYPGELELLEEPFQPTAYDSLGEAEAFLGWQSRSPEMLGEPDDVYALGGGSGRLIVDVASARQLLEMAGADPNLIPDSLDGQAVAVTAYPGLSQNWNEGTVLMQMPSPLIEYPEDVDAAAIGEALLQVLGMEAAQARRLAENIDWTSTLLLPIPENVASFSEAIIDGETGLSLSSIDGAHSAVIWEKEGILYTLTGGEVVELVSIANSLSQ